MIVENSHKNFGEDPCTHTRARGKNVRALATLAKRGEIGLKGGKMGSHGTNFLHAGIFLWDENIMFSKPGTQTKKGRAMGILLIPRFWSSSTETLYLFLYLSEENFIYIIWKLITKGFFWAMTKNYLVPSSWLKIDLESILSLFLDLRPF